ncbi:conserved unknown protein [Ectocarpus siliculosus]|uniref:Ubiquitin-like 1-activating enzyme E1A n=1 Tax=Ectocarpus siliculosus TaxID=2880 RepID=D7FVL3_ECTSI|nr:conserved unknown protein [Ectocarpus siliculosus]|eukprot:CBJ31934.1 conserved unknown protein [Ectocarpus siliculosus]
MKGELVRESSSSSGNEAAGDGAGGIDEDLYSRQLYVMGKTAMAKMGKADVLISGMSGLGAEVAKNVVLAGVRSVTLHDDRPATLEDLSSQFCLGPEAAERGEGRARASVDHLRELNPYVDVRLVEGPLTEEAIEAGGYAAVLLVDETVGFQLRANEACRRAGTAFVSASSRGAFASLFCDFGDSFVVQDTDGEEALACLVGAIVREEEGEAGVGGGRWVVEAVDGERHDFQTGDTIRFEDLRDAEGALLDTPTQEFTVKNINPRKFSMEAGGWAAGETQRRACGGRAVQVKKPSKVSFLPLRKALRPGRVAELTLPTDFGKLVLQPVHADPPVFVLRLHGGVAVTLALAEGVCRKGGPLRRPAGSPRRRPPAETVLQIGLRCRCRCHRVRASQKPGAYGSGLR